MATYTHKVSGVRVSVSDGKDLGADWEPEDKGKPRPKKTEKQD